MIETTLGLMDEAELEKKEGHFEDDNEYTPWVEYWYKGELVHRSATVNLKQGFIGKAVSGQIG